MRNYGYNSFLVIWHNLGRLRAVLESKVLLFTVTHDESLTDPAHETSKNNPNVNSQQPLKIGHTLDIYLETTKFFLSTNIYFASVINSLIRTAICNWINFFYDFRFFSIVAQRCVIFISNVTKMANPLYRTRKLQTSSQLQNVRLLRLGGWWW